MQLHPKLLLMLALANIPIYILVGKLFFQSWSGYLKSLVLGTKITSLWFSREECTGYWKAWARIMGHFLLCSCLVTVEHKLSVKFILE